MAGKGNPARVGSIPSIRRLPFYLAILRRLHDEGREIISAAILAEESGQAAPVVKKDIEVTGAIGKTGVGYQIDHLIKDIETFLGWDRPSKAFLVGVGNLGTALLGYEGFKNHGLGFVAAFDSDPFKIGVTVHGVEVRPLEDLPAMAEEIGVTLAVLAVPSEAGQETAAFLAKSGITSIWSFVPVNLSVSASVDVQREDLVAGLAELMVRRRAKGD